MKLRLKRDCRCDKKFAKENNGKIDCVYCGKTRYSKFWFKFYITYHYHRMTCTLDI